MAATPPDGSWAPSGPRYPALCQVNPGPWLHELGQGLGRPATLDDIPDLALDRIGALGFDWLWLLGVWRSGPLARREALRAERRPAYLEVLADLRDEDVRGSPFAIAGYEVAPELGGAASLARLRARLARRGLRLMLDFVPNHVGLDHPWAREHPEWLVQGTAEDLVRDPEGYGQVELPGDEAEERVLDAKSGGGANEQEAAPDSGAQRDVPAPSLQRTAILAHGRDPNFPAWSDTWQLDYGHPALRAAMAEELARIAAICDGVRCDMAMLLLPEVFEATWGKPADPAGPADPFWPAAIARARAANPALVLLAEAYWDLEWALLAQGFDYCYDKRLYDHLRAGSAEAIRQHLMAGPEHQARLARFVENHDEPRAATAFPAGQHEAATILTYLVPGLRFFHQGQLEGRRRHLPVQLCRWPAEQLDAALAAHYLRLLELLRDPLLRDGSWRLLTCHPAWAGNETWRNIVAFEWRADGEAGHECRADGAEDGGADGRNGHGRRLVVAVCYASGGGQAYVALEAPELAGRGWRLRDWRDGAVFERDGAELAKRGLFVDLGGWGWHVLEVGVGDKAQMYS